MRRTFLYGWVVVAVAARWFVRHRGLVAGILGASSSAGLLVFFPLLTTIAVVGGWRSGAVFLGGLALVLLVPVLLLIRDDPSQVGR